MGESNNVDRRKFIGAAGAGIVAAAIPDKAESATAASFTPLTPGDTVNIGADPKKLAEDCGRAAAKYHKEHGGCARCTISAVQDSLDFVPDDPALHRSLSCLDGGATPNGMANCGTFTAGGIVFGYMTGSDNFGSTRFSHTLIRKLQKKFDARYGSVLCRDVRKKNNGKCTITVGLAAKWIAEIMIDEIGDV